MSAPKLLDSLPQLVAEGLITSEQAERIRTRFAASTTQTGSRMLLVFAILGSLLVGLGIILIIAHNWDDLPRSARTVLALLPVLFGQGLVLYTLQRKPDAIAWRESSALLLACGLCACIALISQIYHINGDLEGYLITCCLLILPLLYLPGSVIATLGYLALVVWYAGEVRFDRGDQLPWMALALIGAAVPMYFREARERGQGIGFWWLSLFFALSIGFLSQWFYHEFDTEHAFGILAVASAFTLVPWLHPGRALRTWPWVFVGGTTVLITFLVFSFRQPWGHARSEGRAAVQDMTSLGILLAIAVAAYVFSLLRRKPFERWPYPEALGLFAICYVVGRAEPWLASLLVNVALLAMGIITVRRGIANDSLKRLNLGLTIVGFTILMRFFDSDMSFVLRGVGFILVGSGFLYMNLRVVRQREKERSLKGDGTHAS